MDDVMHTLVTSLPYTKYTYAKAAISVGGVFDPKVSERNLRNIVCFSSIFFPPFCSTSKGCSYMSSSSVGYG